MSLHIQASYRRGAFNLRFEHRLPSRGVTALLGPSGSGKSTLLRLIAGLERPHAGRIRHGDVLWSDAARGIHLPPGRRRVGFVFQDYALFAHLTVAGNVGYGLPRAARAAGVGCWLERLNLAPYARHYPHQLSGGQRQRVALARALATDPAVLLLDEPFSAVDAALRQHLRAELVRTLADAARPVLLVSHDLDDARYLADRVGVLVDGCLECIGPTAEVFARPSSAAAARVLGWRNLLAVETLAGPRVAGAWGELVLAHQPGPDTAWVGVRPEHLRIGPPGRGALAGHVARIVELGAARCVECRLADGTHLEVHRPWDEPLPAPGEAVGLTPLSAGLRALPERAAGAAVPAQAPDSALARPAATGRPWVPVRGRLANG